MRYTRARTREKLSINKVFALTRIQCTCNLLKLFSLFLGTYFSETIAYNSITI